MRIVGGIFKGRQFHPGKSFRSRPTTDFSKESLFNILENHTDWENISALDLFAGTGSISFELISRGCRQVTAVEKDFVHCRFIRNTADTLGINNFRLIQGDVFQFLRSSSEACDLIFADPPYTMKHFGETATKVLESVILKEGGIFILEHSKEYNFDHLPEFTELRKYGSVHFSFFRGGKKAINDNI
jgi:16S rRNA (guanine(966)-N(2))-methyltransferase RsmD